MQAMALDRQEVAGAVSGPHGHWGSWRLWLCFHRGETHPNMSRFFSTRKHSARRYRRVFSLKRRERVGRSSESLSSSENSISSSSSKEL